MAYLGISLCVNNVANLDVGFDLDANPRVEDVASSALGRRDWSGLLLGLVDVRHVLLGRRRLLVMLTLRRGIASDLYD